MPRKTPTSGLTQATHIGIDIYADQTEFGRAMETYMRLRGRPFPTWSETLAVMKSLGYRKTEKKTKLPSYPLTAEA